LSVNRVLLIGEGAWSQKISGAIRAQDSGWAAEVISARTFITMESNSRDFTEICRKFDILWITTTPRNQIQVLSKLEKAQKKIIVDKPIATNLDEIALIKELVENSQCKIYLSQPWTYSQLWSKMKMMLLSINGEVLIQTERGGSLIRTGFSPEIDWTPHDLYLLADYAKGLEENYSNINLVFREKNYHHIVLKYKIGQDRTFEISAGYADEKKSQWRAYLEGELIAEVDFINGELTDQGGLHSIKLELELENPIISMLDFISENEPTVDWNLIFNLYRDLVRTI
jgi:predicted dehydrogenase